MLGRGVPGCRASRSARSGAAARRAEPRGHAVRDLARSRHGIRGAPSPGALRAPSLRAPKTSFNGRVSPHRRFAFGQLELDDVKAAKNAHGCTVNDVVVSMRAGVVRRWLIEHDELLGEPLVAQIPVSVRTSEQTGTYGNRIMLMSAPLFTTSRTRWIA